MNGQATANPLQEIRLRPRVFRKTGQAMHPYYTFRRCRAFVSETKSSLNYMKSKDNFKTTKHDGDTLGERDSKQKVTKNPAPRQADRESMNTPPENEVYVDLEPDELHLGDDEQPEEVGKKEKKKK